MKKCLSTYPSLTCSVLLLLISLTYSSAQSVSGWLTNASASQKLTPQATVDFIPYDGSGGIIITVDDSQTYQTMDGFGAAMTGSSAYLFNTVLSTAERTALFDELFTDSGIRLSMIRHSIGASDFNLSSYTYNDLPPGQTDPGLQQFSIANDQTHLIPMLQLARQKNPSLKILGSPWSAPAWMKEVHNLNGGWLDIQWYKTYADYLVKYVQAYAAEGLPIWAITLQNEPLHETSSYPSMRMDAGNQISFLKNDIGPAFSTAGLSTHLIMYDHNWDRPDYPIDVLNDPVARTYTIGSGFHAYAGDVSAQTTVHDAHPDKGIWFTEISGGEWSTNWGNNLSWNMRNIIIGSTRHWAKSTLLWNLALDENHGPTNGGCDNCRGVVTINSSSGAVTQEVEYYVLGHISKFVDPGAVRIGSTENSTIQNVAFKNPDGTIVLIAFNNSKKPTQDFKIKQGNQFFPYALEKGAAITFVWLPGSSNVPPTVALTSPSEGASFTAPANILLEATASDTDGSVTQVDFYAGTTWLGSDATAPYTFTWNNVGVGNYSLTAEATDNEGAVTTSDPVNITVTAGGTPTTMHVAGITTGTVNAGQGRKHGLATITVQDDLGQVVANATVSGTFSGTFSESVSGVTDASGSVDLLTTGTAKGSVTVDFCVDNLSHTSLTYDPAQNVVTCTGSGSRQVAIGTVPAAGPAVRVFPNPTRPTHVDIRFEQPPSAPVQLALHATSGRQILTRQFDGPAIRLPLPADLAPGYYVLTLISDGQRSVHRLLIPKN